MIELVKAASQPIIGIAGIVVAILLFRLNYEVRKDNWGKALREFHRSFWDDDVIKEVRKWIALNNCSKQ